MALTYSQWIWGFQVNGTGSSSQNNLIDFVYNGTQYNGVAVAPGVYTADEIAAAVQGAIQAAAGTTSDPTVTFNYSTLQYTFQSTATGTFKLLFGSGGSVHPVDLGPGHLLGFHTQSTSGPNDDITGTGTPLTITSTYPVGTSPSSAYLWTAAEPLNFNSPVTAQSQPSQPTPSTYVPGLLTQRAINTIQHISDGATIESVYIATLRKVQVAFRALLPAEQTNMESFLNWAVQGNRLTWQPDKTSASYLKLVLANPSQVNNMFEWLTRQEATYGVLTFFEQAS